MRSLPLLISFILFSTSAFAHDNYQTAEEIRTLKKEVVKLRKEVRSGHDRNHETGDLKKEVVRLRKNVHQLQDLILELQASIEAQSQIVQPEVVVQPIPVTERPKWACYMKDMRAGGMHSKGFSRVEAKGRLLETCSQRGGVCFENNITCSDE
ncbi:hypothetical protein MO867_18670 [Microbulbifer sp. OS29]|uniref:Uncharacterized protein n=1 Tax=Microbulbifer okhotskensis TaxID=2926617 RepID=A0A9X2J806_9GAMM|nr:hypothetical protein [Microbulbifer okhotskensis]MCO1336360.1 hypothetical protein [Microbulbifer okhotskensis]